MTDPSTSLSKFEMHICFPYLSYSFNGEPTSGVGSQGTLLAQGLVKSGHEVSVIDLAPERQNVITDNGGVQVLRVSAGNLHWFVSKLPVIGQTLTLPVREIEYSIAVWRGVNQANRSRAIDVIEGTETGMLLLALFWRKSPVVIRLHGEQYTFVKHTPNMRLTLSLRLARALQRIALRRAKLLISPSYAHAREIQTELGPLRPPIVVVPNSVAPAAQDVNGHKRNSKTVLYAGRIEKRKGIETFLRAAAQTAQAVPESRFIIAGDFHSSISRNEFEKLLQRNCLNDNVEVLGPLNREKLSELYQHASIAVLPSHYESFGLAALEPMTFGTPVIAADSSALPEVVVPGVTGELVPPGNVSRLASAMITLLQDPDRCARMGKAGTEHAANFDIHRTVAVTERLYKWCAQLASLDADSHVFFSPHPDDVVLSCGGMIDSLISQSKSVQVVTVFGGDSNDDASAFARHLHEKWGIRARASEKRRAEDFRALQTLGVKQFAYWDYLEAPQRRSGGQLLYGSYDELRGTPALADEQLIDEIAERILKMNVASLDPLFYFPLSIGQHVDHQILHAVGRRLSAAGKRVCFYEDYPYVEKYGDADKLNWLPKVVAISLDTKLKAAIAYESQLAGLGGSAKRLQTRLRKFSRRFGHKPHERYWECEVPSSYADELASVTHPLSIREDSIKLRDFKKFIETFNWHDLGEVLPHGTGTCLNLGCGDGRHKRLIEGQGFRCVGLDRRKTNACAAQSDAGALPMPSNSVAGVVAWQILEYVENPGQIVAEAARVLERGGVFCGSVSFLEPLHGRSYLNLSPLIVEKLLRANGFGDIDIRPGLNGFALMLWTWLRRTPIPQTERLAIPITFWIFGPLAATLFIISWLSWRFGVGTGHLMRWISKTAPLEFAGHVIFSARKRARRE
jgi:glycosyltransferase involved in cell wall biosynthesis/SAM-dependent methyltransferase